MFGGYKSNCELHNSNRGDRYRSNVTRNIGESYGDLNEITKIIDIFRTAARWETGDRGANAIYTEMVRRGV